MAAEYFFRSSRLSFRSGNYAARIYANKDMLIRVLPELKYNDE
jgi:hypothetical protein